MAKSVSHASVMLASASYVVAIRYNINIQASGIRCGTRLAHTMMLQVMGYVSRRSQATAVSSVWWCVRVCGNV